MVAVLRIRIWIRIPLNHGSGFSIFIKYSERFQKKVHYFIIFNDLLLYLFDNMIFFNGHKNVQVGSESVRICYLLAPRIRERCVIWLEANTSKYEANIYSLRSESADLHAKRMKTEANITYKRKYYLFCIKANILKQSEANIFKKNRILTAA
jgi:hypothetical protein